MANRQIRLHATGQMCEKICSCKLGTDDSYRFSSAARASLPCFCWAAAAAAVPASVCGAASASAGAAPGSALCAALQWW